jgi:hypothetical protein
MKVITPSGQTFDLGATEEAPTVGIIDYSRRETDDYGVTTVVERSFSRRMSVRLLVPFDEVDSLQQRLAALRATAARWVADDRFACLSFDGFYKEFDVDLNVRPVSWCTMTVEGLAASDPFTDPGDDPAPDGRSSTLQVLKPTLVTDGMLTSNVPEADYPQWSGSTTYPLGARVLRGDAHRIFESVLPGNIGHDPAADAPEWIDIGPTNRWAMFDRALGSVTSAAGAIVVTLAASAVDAVAVLDVKAATVRVQAGAFDRTESATTGAVTIADIPSTSGPVTVTIAGPGQVEVGTLLIGRLLGLGITEANAGAGITDYSRKEVDEFGEVTIVERAWAKRMTANGLVATEAVDLVFDRIAAVRALPCLWIGQDGLQSLSVYGFFKEFSIELGENVSKLSLSIEGLSTAGKVAPLTASVDWPNVGDPNGTKPADNATRNVNRGDWAPGVAYNVGDFFQYEGSSYTVITAHVSAANLPPPNQYVSLLASVGAEGEKGDKGDTGAKGDAGSNGAAGEAAISPSLTTPAYQVWAYANGIVKSYDGATTTFVLKQGGADISASFNMVIAANPNGLQVSLSGRTATVVGASGNAGEFGNTNVLGATLTLRAIGTGAYVGRNFDLNFTLGKLLGGYEIVSALPTTNNFEGREVFNNADGKRYTYTGGVWRATITDASTIADSQLAGMSATKLVGTVSSRQLGVGVGGNRLLGAVPATRPDLYMYLNSQQNTGAVYELNVTYGGQLLSPLPNGQYPDGTGSYTLPDLSGFCVHQTNTAKGANPDYFMFRYIRDMNGGWTNDFACEDGKTYEFSMYLGAHRCTSDIIVVAARPDGSWAAGGTIGTAGQLTAAEGKFGGTNLNAWKRVVSRVTVPVGGGATRLLVYMRKFGTDAGQGDSWTFMCYPQLVECSPSATEIVPYSPPPQAIMVAQNIFTKSLTSEVIAANAIGTNEMAARSITAKQLTMTDFENIMVDGDLASGTLDAWSRNQNGVGGLIIRCADGGAGTSWPSRYALNMLRNGNSANELSIVNGKESWDQNSGLYGISVVPGDEFAFECQCWATNGSQVSMDMIMRNSAGNIEWLAPTAVYNTAVGGVTMFAYPGEGFVTLRGNFKYTGSSVGRAFLRLFGPGTGTPNAMCYYWNIKMRRRNTAQLIVDGAITANAIAAGQVQTDHIGAGQVTAAKIAVTELSAITANLGLMRTATAGRRTEIDSNGMRAYDANGTLRVRAGVWAV